MKPEIQMFKNAVNDEAKKIHDWKKWDRRNPALKIEPHPPYGNDLRATLLCMVLSHLHGKLHCRTVWGRDLSRRIELNSLADQRKFVETQLSKRWSPLSTEEGAVAKTLLQWGDERYEEIEQVGVRPDGARNDAA
jgi:hypothetical protein